MRATRSTVAESYSFLEAKNTARTLSPSADGDGLEESPNSVHSPIPKSPMDYGYLRKAKAPTAPDADLTIPPFKGHVSNRTIVDPKDRGDSR